MSEIRPPNGFFTSSSSSSNVPISSIGGSFIDVVPETHQSDSASKTFTPVKSASKFSFAGLGSKQSKKVSMVGTVDSTDNIPVDTKFEDRLTYTENRPVKVPYAYVGLRTLRFDDSTKKPINYGDLMRRNVETLDTRRREREIEDRNAIQAVTDLFGGPAASDEEEVSDLISGRINSIFEILTSNTVYGKKEKVVAKGTISPETMFENLYNIFNYINAEERGRLIIHIVFGCLISRNKLLGAGGKSASGKFKDLITSLNKLTTGSSQSSDGRIYNRIIETITSPTFDKYRLDMSASDQVTNVVNFINRLVISKLPVLFPLGITFSDPVAVYVQAPPPLNKVLDVKTVTITSKPTLENLNVFFSIGVAVKKVETKVVAKKKKDDDDYYDDNDEAMFER